MSTTRAAKQKRSRIVSRAIRSTVVVMYMAVLGAFGTASSPQQSGQRWHPRRSPAGTVFVGDQVCAQCHKSKVTSLAQSAMGMAMEPIADSKVLTENPEMRFRVGPFSYQIKRNDKQSMYIVTDGAETISLPILYAVGQGRMGQTYVVKHDGAMYETLVSYFKEVGGLDFTIGAARAVPASLNKAIGRRLSDNETLNCFSCHSTGGIEGNTIRVEQITPGVHCEACHGPGGQHVAAVSSGKPGAKLIFNPARMSGDELSQEFCAACHRGSDEFSLLQSMEINNVRFQPYRIFHSKCYSDDRRISCTACHNPHEPLKHDSAYYDSKCVACHAQPARQAAAAAAEGPAASVCRVGSKNCVSCHMPKLGPAAAHFKFTDHYIRIVRPKEAYPN